MISGMAWRSVSDMLIIKNKVANGVGWRLASPGVSPKGIFNCSKLVGKKFFKENILVV